jgi:V8-like Glu-specific endopeptidase
MTKNYFIFAILYIMFFTASSCKNKDNFQDLKREVSHRDTSNMKTNFYDISTDSLKALLLIENNRLIDSVIYGRDNRRDFYQVRSKKAQLNFNGVCVLIENEFINERDSTIELFYFPQKYAYELCTNEPYENQHYASFCTGFAINDSTIISAGHCITGNSNDSYRLLFDYHMGNQDSLSEIKQSAVFTVKYIMDFNVENLVDYSIIIVNEKIPKFRHLKMRTRGDVKINQRVYSIGSPSGMPLKRATGAKIRENYDNSFVANLDTYGGNSGSPIFNSSGRVEGILIKGEEDYVQLNNCNISNKCLDNECSGEIVTKINIIRDILKDLNIL